MKIALAQLNPTVADIAGNTARALEMLNSASDAGADLVVFPELAVSAYPHKDLVFERGFVHACEHAADALAQHAPADLTFAIGSLVVGEHGRAHNAALVYRNGSRIATYAKRLLPTYDVFDEDRFYAHGDEPCIFECAGLRVGVCICEDLWFGRDAGSEHRYAGRQDPVHALCDTQPDGSTGAELIVSLSASPYVIGKHAKHTRILCDHARRHSVHVASVNLVGAHDEIIFDGRSSLVSPDGTTIHQCGAFAEDIVVLDVDGTKVSTHTQMDDLDELAHALPFGIHEYCAKTGHEKVIIGLSGGIDSALVAALAARALGPESVICVAMPGPYSSAHSLTDARTQANALGVQYIEAPIADAFIGIRATLDAPFDLLHQPRIGAVSPDLAEQNIQARARGLVLMTISNRIPRSLVLTTGNKSEIAVGYCTLYGDMCGGLAPISDLVKTRVWDLSRYLNEHHARLGFAYPPIPQQVIDKPPSAELAPDQTDEADLMKYADLDAIVELHIEHALDEQSIATQTGIALSEVQRIVRRIRINEYKRKQMATGLKVTGKAFGYGRRFPIAHRFKLSDNND
ncbi:MAG: NAD+ synthase [Phycisphaeraceae bacterium]|nr:NAD+ synthase [Phycisphaerales bacterium]MCB9860416.1 NAD+ synthase [Phycisphaeraceae bacterium]